MHDIAAKLLEEIEANKLPSLPHILVKLLQACREEEVCFDTLSELIGQDASLCTRVIKAANSPVYGRVLNLSSIKQILMFLGLDTIKSIAITASIKQFFSEYSTQRTAFLKSFWHHSLTCANIARSLAELTAYPYVEEAYLSGLLHDIGKLMLEPQLGHEYKSFEHGIFPATELLTSEQRAFGLNHTELAAKVLEKWQLPDVVCDAVRYHHASLEQIQQAHQLAKVVFLANLLASELPEDQQTLKTEAAIKLFDLSESIVERLVKQSLDQSRAIAISMDIDIGESEQSQKKDELKQLQLAQEVRDNALILSGHASINVNSTNFYRSIQQSINLIFDINRSLLFIPSRDQQMLSPATEQQIPDSHIFSDLKLDMNSDSLLVRCLSKHRVMDSFSVEASANLSIMDQQICRGLKSEGMICIPIIKSGQSYASLLLACNKNQAQQLLESHDLLTLFADNIAEKLNRNREYRQKLADISNNKNEQFMQRARQIVHEANNPLSVIRNYLQLLSKKLDTSDPAQAEIQTIKQEIDRIANIILHCKDTNEFEASDITEIDINKLVSELTDIYKSSIFATHNIETSLVLDKKLNKIKSDRDVIKQIITNLVKNSVEAMNNNGKITISTGNINTNGENYVELELHDTGSGIPEIVMNNLYKPVTSNKGNGHSGLGLSITKNLVDRIGGTISCKTNNTGTVFIIQLPVENKA